MITAYLIILSVIDKSNSSESYTIGFHKDKA